MEPGKKIYFASDFHLGNDGNSKFTSREREIQIVQWLDQIKVDAAEIYLVGDVFEFWFEYSTVVPKGYVRLLGKLAEIQDSGIPIFFFIGNHDMWMFKYFEEELGITTFRTPIQKTIAGKKFFIGHGDGLGPGDTGYKILKKVFSNKLCQWLFERLHPNFGIGLARFWSGKSRDGHKIESQFLGEEKEWLIAYCNKKIESLEVDYFVFGHRHLPIDWRLKNDKSRYINLGEWMNYNSYAVFDGEHVEVLFFGNPDGEVVRNI